MVLTVKGDVAPGVLPAQHGANGNANDIEQLVTAQAAQARIGEFAEMMREAKGKLPVHAKAPDHQAGQESIDPQRPNTKSLPVGTSHAASHSPQNAYCDA